MGDNLYFARCNTVPTLSGSELRFSFKQAERHKIPLLPVQFITCKEITPPQQRLQWNVSTDGPRLDDYSALRVGSDDWYLELGSRSTYAGGPLKDAEQQRVGVVTGSLAGHFRISYWNDHAFSFWKPIGSGLPFFEGFFKKEPDRQWDFGDTAGVKLSWDLGRGRGFPLSQRSPWNFDTLSLTMRLATGIPDNKSVTEHAGVKFYSRIDFDGIDRGDLDLNAQFSKGDLRLEVGFWLNSGAVRNVVQSKLIHKGLDIPELPATNKTEVLLYMKLFGW